MTVQLCAYVWLPHNLGKCLAHNSDTSFLTVYQSVIGNVKMMLPELL